MTYSVFPRIHSLYGRFLGVTPEGYYTGENGNMERVYSFTSATTATLVPSNGISYFSVTTAYSTGGSTAQYLLDYPRPGVKLAVGSISASTQRVTITTTSAIVVGFNSILGGTGGAMNLSSASSAYTNITLQGLGTMVQLEGISTAAYLVTSLEGFSSANSTGAGGGPIFS